MLRQRHHHLHAVAPTTSTTTPPTPPDFRTSSTSAACRSSQQAAAAWAWFEHGGSSCITPGKAEGLVAAQRRAKRTLTKPSRFRIEVLIGRQIPQKGSADQHAIPEDGCRFATRHRRHSFHDNRTSDMYRRFSSSCRKATGSPCFDFDIDGTIGDQNEAKNELKGTGDSSCQDDEGSSLLDKFEVEAVRRQLHYQLIKGRISPSCSSLSSSSTNCSTEPHEDNKSHKAQHDHRHHHAHLKPRRSFKSSDAAAGHKPVPDNEHHHHINDMVHRLLHFRVKTSVGRSISSVLAPAICNSIATANSIVDHHHGQSPKHQKATTPINYQTAKRQHAALHNWGSMQNVVNGGVSAAADAEHERRDFTLKHNDKSHQKEVPRSDYELIGDGVSSTPTGLHHSTDSKISKALLPLVSHLPRLSALALGHHKDGSKSWRDDGSLAALQALSNDHSHLASEHFHIHHHHHHHYHHLEHTNEASKGARVRHFLQEGDAGHHVLQAPNLYKVLKEELAIPAADREGGPAQPHQYAAAQNLLSPQSASRSKLEKL